MPTAGIAVARDNLMTALSKSDAFQAWTGTGSAAAALARIHKYATDPPDDGEAYTLAELDTLRPYVVVSEPEDDPFTIEMEAPDVSSKSGTLNIRMEQATPSADENDPSAAEENWTDTLDGILGDLEEQAKVGGDQDFVFTRLRLAHKSRSRKRVAKVQDDHLIARIVVQYEKGV